jgi:hypothetical protein
MDSQGLIQHAKDEWRSYDACVDTLDGKACALIGFVSVLFGLSVFQAQQASAISPSRLMALACFGVAALIAVFSWRVSRQRYWAGAAAIRERQSEVDEEALAGELLNTILSATKSKEDAAARKGVYVSWAGWLFAAGMIFMLVSLASEHLHYPI